VVALLGSPRSGDARMMRNMGGNTMRLLPMILAALSVALVASDAQADTLAATALVAETLTQAANGQPS
jgi:hypothetical protein